MIHINQRGSLHRNVNVTELAKKLVFICSLQAAPLTCWRRCPAGHLGLVPSSSPISERADIHPHQRPSVLVQESKDVLIGACEGCESVKVG